MSMENDGPAFPYTAPQHPYDDQNGGRFSDPGMTLRDYFAAAVAGHCYAIAPTGAPIASIAQDAYELAEAMLKVRNSNQSSG